MEIGSSSAAQARDSGNSQWHHANISTPDDSSRWVHSTPHVHTIWVCVPAAPINTVVRRDQLKGEFFSFIPLITQKFNSLCTRLQNTRIHIAIRSGGLLQSQQHGVTSANVVLSGPLQLHRSINWHQLSRMDRSFSPTAAAAAASKSRRGSSFILLADYQQLMHEQSGSNVTAQTPDI